jgi:hypothetical protein
VKTRGLATEWHAEYGTTEAYGSNTPKSTLAGRGRVVAVRLTALQPGTTYHYAFVISSSAGTVTSPDQTFTTPITPPVAVTGLAVGVTQSTATLTGAVDPMGLQTTYEIQYGPNVNYGTQMFGDAGAGQGAVPVALELPNLAPESPLHFRVVARNMDGTSYGADQTFTTPGFPNPVSAPPAPALLATPTVAALEGAKVTTTHRATHKTRRKKKPRSRPRKRSKRDGKKR